MAENAHLWLKLSGTDIKGDSTQTSLGRADSIECTFVETGVKSAREAGSGMATGRRQHQPIKIRKGIDKSTPLIFKGLVENQVAEGILKFYRPNPTGDGTTQHFYTVTFKGGRVAAIKGWSPDSSVPATSNMPEQEEVEFVFHTIIHRYEDGGVEHEDSWSEGAR